MRSHTSNALVAITLTLAFASQVVAGLDDSDASHPSPMKRATAAERRTAKKLVYAHAIVMVAAWGFFAPVGVLIGRYGRSIIPNWVRYHKWIQVGLVTPLTLVAAALGVGAMQLYGGGKRHFANKHSIMGLCMVLVLVIMQITSGYWIHKKYDAARTRRPVWNWVHMVLGIGLLALGGATIYTGLQLEGMLLWMKVTFWTWSGILMLAFVGGYTLIPRQVGKERKADVERRSRLIRTLSIPAAIKIITSPLADKGAFYTKIEQ